MVDVDEGDCYVVDLFDSQNPSDVVDRKKWKRFLIDTGSERDFRLGTIIKALADVSTIDMWLTKALMITTPPLAGVIVTHSDRDHSGNAHSLFKELYAQSRDPRYATIDFAAPNKATKVPVYLTPSVQWTRELHPSKIAKGETVEAYNIRAVKFYKTKALEFFKVVLRSEKQVEVQLVNQVPTADRSFANLGKLAETACYAIVYRFHVFIQDAPKREIDAILVRTDRTWVWEKQNLFLHSQDKWLTDSTFEIPDISAMKDCQILVEVGLQPKVPLPLKRTVLKHEINADPITGPWLRITTKLPPVDFGTHIDVPYATKFEPRLIDLSNKYNTILNDGAWSSSVMGCADGNYVRDFQHLVLQSLIPKDEAKCVISDDLALWSQYANRASIINFFSYLIQPSGIVSPHENPGAFKLLFTGDAFELGQGIEKMANWNNARRDTFNNKTLEEYRFTPIRDAKSSAGNIMNWLSGDETTNQKVHVDVLKVPHHGSQVTTEPTLFRHVSASVYLISGSSKSHGHPTVQVLSEIVKSVRLKDEMKGALAPEAYRSKDNNKDGLPDIRERMRPRLVFCSFACRDQSKKAGREKLDDIIKELCIRKDKTTGKDKPVNIKFLVQKTENTCSRIRFGWDEPDSKRLRVEWDEESWEELRPYDLAREKWNTVEDPLAYPRPGYSPGWEAPVKVDDVMNG
ncbi:hypothetical protein FOVSG1_011214 [Fusarium oxysporum f. sp. vasinfectum]